MPLPSIMLVCLGSSAVAMLVACADTGVLTEAARRMCTGMGFHCPWCKAAVTPKPGRTVVPHFAHAPGSECASAGEGIVHLRAKRVLADEFRAIGYEVELEKDYPEHRRRLDMEVCLTERIEQIARFRHVRASVELQDSSISAAMIFRRKAIDQYRIGLNRTLWILIGTRASSFLRAQDGEEVRCGQEALALAEDGDAVLCLDVEEPALWAIRLYPVIRAGGIYPDRIPKSIRKISKTRIPFTVLGEPAEASELEPDAMRSEGDFQRYRLAEALLESRWLAGIDDKHLPLGGDDLYWSELEHVAAAALSIDLGEHQQLWIRKTVLSIAAECPPKAPSRNGPVANRHNPQSPGTLYLACRRLLGNNGVPVNAYLDHEACPVGGPAPTPRGRTPDGWPLDDQEIRALRKF